MSAADDMESVRSFLKAGQMMAKIHVDRALADFDGHSCYDEGWAAGYSAAMKVVADFVADVTKEPTGA